MKEFLKSFRRKLAFLLAVLLVLGNVSWEAVVRANDPEQNTILFTSSISEYFYGDEIIIDLNEYKTNKNLVVSYDWTSFTPNAEDAVLDSGKLTIMKAFSGTITATAENYDPQSITISVNQPTAALASVGEIGTLTYGEDKAVALVCSTGSRLQDFTFTPSGENAVNVQVNGEQVNTLKLTPLKATDDNITIDVKLKDEIKEYYTNASYSTIINVDRIDKASFGDITVKNGDATYANNSNIEVTFGDTIILSCSESTNSAGTWICTSSDTEENYVKIGEQNTDGSGNATFPLTIVKASEGVDGLFSSPITITVSKKDENYNYNEKSTIFNITHIKKADQSGFEVYKVTDENTKTELTEKTDTITFSDALCYEIVGDQENGATYTYKSSNEDVAKSIAECPGKFQILKDGQVNLTVTKSKTNYNNKSETISLTVSPSNAEFVSNFGIKSISDGKVTAREAIENTGGYQLSATGEDVSIVGYDVTNEDGSATGSANITQAGLLKITAAGKYKITATAKKAGYTDQTLTYVLEVYREEQGVSFVPGTIPPESQVMFADSESQYIILKASATQEGTVSYEITNVEPAGTIESYDSEGCKIKITKAGPITVKASVSEGVKYKGAEETITINVSPNNKPLFSDIEVVGATVDDTGKSISFTKNTVNVKPTGALEGKTGITYNYTVNDNNVAEFTDASKGELTLKKAGTVTITVVASLANYENTTKTYDLEVTRAPQSLTFATANPDALNYGTKSFQNKATVSTTGCQESTHDAIQYKIVEGSEIASVNKTTGELTFTDKKTGTVKVKASKAECDQYAACEAEYSVTVKNINTPENPYSLAGTIDEGSTWYRSNVTIKPCAGYKISESNSFEDSNWKDYLEVSTQGRTSGKQIYLKDSSTGGITGAINVADFCIDTIQPSAQEISYSTSVSEKIIKGLTLGFYKEKVEITFTAKDEGSNQASPTGSGISKFEWWTTDASNIKYYSEQDKVETKTDGSYTYTITINKEFRDKVCFTAYDFAGNKASNYIEGEKLIVLENDEPVLSEEYSETNQKAEDTENGILYYNNSAELYLTITEENFYAEDIQNYSVKKDGAVYDNLAQTSAEWLPIEDTLENDYKKTITLTEDGHYVVSLKYNDPAQNGITDASPYAIDYVSKTIVVDKTKPEMAVSYTTPKQVIDSASITKSSYVLSVENRGYTLFYDKKATVTIEISERNFDKDKVTITVIKDGVESVKNGSNEEFSWNDENDKHTTSVTFDEDGSYVVKVSCKDLAENEMTLFKSEKIIIDSQAPTIEVSFANDIVKEYSNDSTDTKLYKVSEEAFAENIVATITITTANFRASDVEFTLADSADAGLTVPNTAKTYSEYLKDSENWVIDEENTNRHTITVPFKKDLEKTYKLSVNYTGLSLIPAEEAKNAILVIDNEKPIGKDITSYTSNSITEGERVGYVYGGETKVTFQITETNFVAEDVKFYVNKDGIENAVSSDCIGTWTTNDGVSTCDITVGKGNVDGDYQVRMSYTDRSNNKMVDCYSKYIVIDTQKPVISIDYGTSDPTAINGKYYGSNRTATITVQDRTIVDVDKLNWTLTAVDVKNGTVTIPEGKESAWSDTGSHTWTKTIEFSTDAKYDFTVAPVDALGKTDSKQQIFTIDKAKPTNLTIRYSHTENWYDNVLRSISFGYYKEPITVTMTATDVTSPIESFAWSYARQGDNASIVEIDGGTITKESIYFNQNGDTATATFVLPKEEAKQYRGNISFTVTDMANNSESKADEERVVVYDTIPSTRLVAFTDPAQVVETATKETVSDYDPNQKQDLTLYYNTDMTVTITVTEANFYPQDTHVFVNDVEISDLTWAHTDGTDEYIAKIPLTENGSYIIKMAEYSDRSKNQALIAYESSQIIIDNNKPTMNVKFSDNIAKNTDDGFQYNKGQITEDGKATITVVCNHFRASDFVLNLDGSDRLDDATKNKYITYLKNDSNWTHEGKVHTAVLTFDKSKVAAYNMKLYFTGLNKLVTETIAEKLIMDVNVPTLETVYEAEEGTITENNSTRYVYGGATTVTLNLTEDYFVKGDVTLTVLKDGKACPEAERTISEWQSAGTKHTRTIELGTGDVDGDYQIFMSYTDRSGNAMKSLVSRYIIVDTKKPVVNITYAANDPEVLNTSFYGANRTATLTVQDRTIVESEKLTWAFGATNILGQAVTIPAANISDWSLDTKTHTWTRVVKLTEDAIYNFSLNGTDCLGKTSDIPVVQSYTMDTTAPVDLKIQYSEGGNWVDNVLGTISFGYYKTPITVTLTAKDITSPIDYFDWTYTRRADSNNTPEAAGERITSFTQSGDTATATFTLTPDQAAQYCGNITFTATNKAGHQSAVKADDNRVIVADNISPTRVVEFTPATQVINKTSRQTVESYDPNKKQDLILFYDKPMNITLKVTEANFYPQDAVVTVNDAATDVTWTRKGDEYTATVTFSKDGDYVLRMAYADRSGNAMEAYESSQITIDTVSPTISMEIVGSSAAGEYDGTKYFGSNTSAIITIVEHNFRAADVTGSVVALSSSDQGVGVQDFAAFLSNEANWITNGDTHIATYSMTADAIYNFNVEYADLAKHAISAATEKYCVDKEAPGNVSLTYSTPIVETILEAISFKFYNAQATVSVVATDETSGVNKIVYSLLKANGASDTNLELLEQTISEDAITYNNGRREATTQFKLPASDLRAGTQFNGTIKLVVYDRAMNSVAYENNERVVIDNISPQLDIQYNNSTSERNNIFYYGEDIRATLHMNEANFYRDDVKVTVSRNNGGFEPITVNWSDTNADIHIGNFTLSEDGDYVIMVEYADKSTNQMVSYTSEQMTIDTDMPVVTISGVENRKPYASGTVGFTVSVSDTNLDSESFAPQFSAWVKEGNTIVQKDMLELGAVTVSNDKNSCTYIVENLPEDGIYTVSTSVMDMVGHTVNSLHMDNESGVENEFVRFSVNRNGSTYYIEDATTLEMLGSFLPYDKAGNVVVREVNPTALSDVTVTMFKDEKTIALEENSNFAFNLQHNEGEWYEYAYTIYRTNFEEDGIYSILLHSKDEAEHVAENNLEEKNVTISFAIDSTSPVLIVSNLEDNATYNANSYTVYMQASDNLKLSEAVVTVDDKKVGSWSEAEQNLSADDTYEFIINENNKAQKVSMKLVDKAGNRTTQDYTVTVTTNAFVRVINNKPLMFGIVGGATGAVVVPVAGVALFGKKKLFFVLLNKLKGVFIK